MPRVVSEYAESSRKYRIVRAAQPRDAVIRGHLRGYVLTLEVCKTQDAMGADSWEALYRDVPASIVDAGRDGGHPEHRLMRWLSSLVPVGREDEPLTGP